VEYSYFFLFVACPLIFILISFCLLPVPLFFDNGMFVIAHNILFLLLYYMRISQFFIFGSVIVSLLIVVLISSMVYHRT